ncbi:MAG: iron-containing alcohol dehydrogenase [Acidobacteria bacterium]|nr:iron-containing alcohol dehydrogenase [Acidobacteriota bacterium]
MTEPFDVQQTIRLVFGAGSLDRVGQLALDLCGTRVALISDPGIEEIGYVDQARRALINAGLDVLVFTDVHENPTTDDVARGVQAVSRFQPDLLVALGGGSAMDCAKGINFLLSNGGAMEDYWGFGKATKPMIPSIGIPTTAGTGSDGQSYALISRAADHKKMACGDIQARFRTVILDADLPASAPRAVIAASSLDAMAHALESYVSTRANPLSRMYASHAWRLLHSGVDEIADGKADNSAWGDMLLGAHFAGCAIEASMLGAAHACANPLTARYGITHGVAVSLMLPAVLRGNNELMAHRYARLAQDACLSGPKPGHALAAYVQSIKARLGLPERIAQVAQVGDWSELVDDAMTQWTGTFNPRPLDREWVKLLYEEVA